MTFFQPGARPEDTAQACPICGRGQPQSPRYPRYLCAPCVEKAVDEHGRRLAFFNTSISGGFMARYVDTGDAYNSHVCFVEGVRCRADEARFGGIVLQPVEEE